MRSRRQGFVFCWILVFAIIALFSHFIQCQPQNYFKGSQITQLPSKALPRIGRRSGSEFGDSGNSESSETTYSFQIPSIDSYPPEVYKQMFAEEMALPGTNFMHLIKRIIKDKVLRNEKPIGIFRGRNEK